MKFKFTVLSFLLFLFIIGSTANCDQKGIDKSSVSKSDSTSSVINNDEINQTESIKPLMENIFLNLNETKNSLSQKIDSEVLSLETQIGSTQKNISDLTKQLDELRKNYSNILYSVMSTNWTQVGMFWVSMLLVLVTFIATYINYKVFRVQTDPEVIIYITPDNRRPTIINLIIENIGKGVAKNINFSSNRPIPCRAFGLGNDAKSPPDMTTGPLITGIPELGPSAKRIITWGQYHGLLKGLGDDLLTVTADYSSAKGFFRTPNFKASFFLDIKSFEGTDASDQNYDKKTAESLEDIAKSIKKLIKGR